ncbi:MAG: type II secretion system F family protein [Candidatus Bathyarchaeia archaeon]
MSQSEVRKSIRKAYRHVKRKLRPLFPLGLSRVDHSAETLRVGVTKPQAFAFQLIGGKTARFLPLFRGVDVNLRRSGIKISFRAYVSLAILASLLVSISLLILVPVNLILLLHLPYLPSLLFGVGSSLFAGALVVIGFYVFPVYRADDLKRRLDDGLPFTAGYMAILAGADVPPDRIFRSLAQIEAPFAVSDEARTIVRDVELFGFDILSALKSASSRTPSSRFKGLLEGFIATVHSGGSLTRYLTDKSRQFMKLKQIALTKLSDTFGMLAEFYVTVLVVGPLILVVMLSVMAMLGGGASGLLNPRLLLYLLTYLGIPIGSIVFLIILDMFTPRR